MKNDFDNHSFRDFEYIPGMDAWARARMFQAYLDDQTAKGQLNYRLVTTTGCGPVVEMQGQKLISLVSNDYLGFTQHPAVKTGRYQRPDEIWLRRRCLSGHRRTLRLP